MYFEIKIVFFNHKHQPRNLWLIGFILLFMPVAYWLLNQAGYMPPADYFWAKAQKQEAKPETAPEQLLNYRRSLAELIPAPINKSQTAIYVDKSDYQLTLYYQKQPVKSYPIVLGTNPVGDKQREGDRKTPEGVFKVRDLYPHPSWSKFIWLDYPNEESWRKHLAAKKAGDIDFSSTVGSEIGIHGVPANGDRLIDQKSNWTWGCVALKNQDVDEIYSVIQTGTTVTIVP